MLLFEDSEHISPKKSRPEIQDGSMIYIEAIVQQIVMKLSFALLSILYFFKLLLKFSNTLFLIFKPALSFIDVALDFVD